MTKLNLKWNIEPAEDALALHGEDVEDQLVEIIMIQAMPDDWMPEETPENFWEMLMMEKKEFRTKKWKEYYQSLSEEQQGKIFRRYMDSQDIRFD